MSCRPLPWMLLIGAALLPRVPACAQPEEVLLQFMDQPPLSALDAQGRPEGRLVERMRQVAAQGGLQLRWELVPLKRSLQELRDNRRSLCVLGVFRTAERESFAQFSRPLSVGAPQRLIARTEAAARLRQAPDARSALLDPSLRLLVFDGVSYGAEIDAWLRERQGPTVRAVSGAVRVVEMLSRDRADFAIITSDGLDSARQDGVQGLGALQLLEGPQLPRPPARHVACSQQVPASWMRHLDQAIRAVEIER